MKRNPFTLVVGLLLILIFGSWLCIFQVRQSEVAVVTTFGKPTRPITEPGPTCNCPSRSKWSISSISGSRTSRTGSRKV